LVVAITGSSSSCDREFFPIFRNTIFIVAGLILITTILLVKNSMSLEKELRRRK